MWCEDAGISGTQYQSLREILSLESSAPSIPNLPRALKTLKRHAIGQLPLLPLRKKNIALIGDKLPSGAPATKGGQANAVPKEDLSFFDAKVLFQAFLNSDTASDLMYFGMGQFVNPAETTELWHSHAWRSSLRTTGGQYPKYPNGDPLFASDFVEYLCNTAGCTCETIGPVHLGRVISCGKDCRSDAEPDEKGHVYLEIQEAHRRADVPEHSFLEPDVE